VKLNGYYFAFKTTILLPLPARTIMIIIVLRNCSHVYVKILKADYLHYFLNITSPARRDHGIHISKQENDFSLLLHPSIDCLVCGESRAPLAKEQKPS
jgi:hypothetical protein